MTLGDLSVPALRQQCSTLVARKPDLFGLNSASERARARSGRVLLLSGAAAMGKTRLAAEFSAFARSNGVQILERSANLQPRAPDGGWKQISSQRVIRDDWGKIDRSRGGILPRRGPNQSARSSRFRDAGRILNAPARAEGSA